MIIKLVDAKKYYKIKGTEFYRTAMAFNTGKKAWTNGWCPCSVLKLLPDDTIIARISNELVPTEIYDGIEITVKECERLYKTIEYWIDRIKGERA